MISLVVVSSFAWLPSASNSVNAVQFAYAVEQKTKGCGGWELPPAYNFVNASLTVFKQAAGMNYTVHRFSVGGFSVNDSTVTAKDVSASVTIWQKVRNWNYDINATNSQPQYYWRMQFWDGSFGSLILQRTPSTLAVNLHNVKVNLTYASTDPEYPESYIYYSSVDNFQFTFRCITP
jgi:hypothetical protein